MALDFLPFKDGQVLKADDLNELVDSIRNGTIFLSTTIISNQLSTMSTDIINLDVRVTHLETLQSSLSIREQHELLANQSSVNLSHAPILDTETVYLNGLALSKDGIPLGFVGDYSLSGSIITFNPELWAQIIAGDMIVVQYRYEV